MFVVAVTSVVTAIAVPMMSNTLGDYRLRGDARGITHAVYLSKTRAAAEFTRTRLFVDLGENTYRREIWRDPSWVAEGGMIELAQNDRFSFGVVGAPPPNSQAAIGQAPACLDADGEAIGNTACLVFNSRGIPIDAGGAPTTSGALYVTDNTAVYGVTLSASGLVSLWRTGPAAAPSWVIQ